MTKSITIQFTDGSTHIYDDVPDDVSQEQVESKANEEFNKPINSIADSDQIDAEKNANKPGHYERVAGDVIGGAELASSALKPIAPELAMGGVGAGGYYAAKNLIKEYKKPVPPSPPSPTPSPGTMEYTAQVLKNTDAENRALQEANALKSAQSGILGRVGQTIANSPLGTAGKYLGKIAPGAGLALNAADAYERYKAGDYLGAGISGASGITGMVPGIGTLASLGLAGTNILRDRYNTGEWFHGPETDLDRANKSADLQKKQHAIEQEQLAIKQRQKQQQTDEKIRNLAAKKAAAEQALQMLK